VERAAPSFSQSDQWVATPLPSEVITEITTIEPYFTLDQPNAKRFHKQKNNFRT